MGACGATSQTSGSSAPGHSVAEVDFSEVRAPQSPPGMNAHIMRQYTDSMSLLPILESGSVALVNPQHVLQIARDRCLLKRRQELPSHAFMDSCVNSAGIQKMLILSISYCWLSKLHPDPDGYHVKTLAALLECFMSGNYASAQMSYGNNGKKTLMRKHGWCFGGRGRDVGMFLDWASLYQKPRSGDEDESFKKALHNMHIWYAHASTLVWMLTCMPSHLPQYSDRGWPTFERAVTQFLSPSHYVLEITHAMRERLLDAGSAYKAGDYIQLTIDAKANPPRPPLMPEDFNKLIQTKDFTNGADCDVVVKPKYKTAFEDLVASAKTLDFSGLDWRRSEVDACIKLVLSQCPLLESLDLTLAKPEMPFEKFIAFLPDLPTLKKVNFNLMSLEGDFAALGKCCHLEVVSLYRNRALAGDIAVFAAFKNLQEVNLLDTQVYGNIIAFANLVHMRFLKAANTNVSGNLTSLTRLEKLQVLSMSRTEIQGDISALSGLANLDELILEDVSVCGDISALSHLCKLRTLSIVDTLVSGGRIALRNLPCLSSVIFSGEHVLDTCEEHGSTFQCGQLWIVNAHDGALVREGQRLTSHECTTKLACGSTVREVERFGARLSYELVSGHGPQTGWVTTTLRGKDLLLPVEAHNNEDDADA